MPSRRGRPRSRTTRSGTKPLGSVERLDAVGGGAHLVALLAQRAAQDVGDLGVVLDDEDPAVAVSGSVVSIGIDVSGAIRRSLRDLPAFYGAGVVPSMSKRATCSCVRRKRPARRKPKAKAKARSPRPKLHLPQALEQRHLDLIGLLLIAAGVYLSFVLFFGWDGGKVGYGLETGLTTSSVTSGRGSPPS